MLTRRKLLGLSAFTLCAGAFGLPRIVLAQGAGEQRMVYIFLRGGMDGLFAVPPYGDPQFTTMRTELAIPAPGQEAGALKLDGMFGLHPSLTNLYGLYTNQQLIVFHAIASPYRARSHFDAQNLIENGTAQAHLRESGFLNAALGAMPRENGPLGIAIGTSVPLSLIGNMSVSSWSPSALPEPGLDMVGRLQEMYANDAELTAALTSAQAAQQEMMQGHKDKREQMAADGDKQGGQKLRQAFVTYMTAVGKFLSNPDGPRIATVDLSGFDSHVGQTNPVNPLVQAMTLLDNGVAALKDQMGATWDKTAVLIVTEFGRTVAMNGSHGTDHGTATAAFLTGGAVRGGRVIADWPGLAPANLFENRDLYPTSDLRGVEMAVLRDHMGISESAIHQTILPGSSSVKSPDGLFV